MNRNRSLKMGHVLPASFFSRPTLTVAEELIGQNLCRYRCGRTIRLPITEVEAYDGFDDEASHAHRGPTKRNSVMFGPAGYWYVYLCYGVHWLLNVVTGPKQYPAAILIRGAGPCRGPGRVTKALAIDGTNSRKRAARSNRLWIERSGSSIPSREIERTPRIGVQYAASPWREAPYRFFWSGTEQ